MVSLMRSRKTLITMLAVAALMCLVAPFSFAAAEGAPAAGSSDSVGNGLKAMGAAIGAGIAIAGAGLGTGRAQGAIGAAGAGAIAEKPEAFANVLVLVLIPETVVVFGFVIAFMLLGKVI